ncbi:hypothetical protein Salat_0066900 [Sesamum alatum]|uniref:Uncharacterized protein n=1 Tax=Sesamum alatum TaxID=300844 RepID=A0AAE2CWS5_9LAMI|nr:hypothetical protein Salat_0066900 [Sesamum alatum]
MIKGKEPEEDQVTPSKQLDALSPVNPWGKNVGGQLSDATIWHSKEWFLSDRRIGQLTKHQKHNGYLILYHALWPNSWWPLKDEMTSPLGKTRNTWRENVSDLVDRFEGLQDDPETDYCQLTCRVGKLSIKIPWKKLGWDPLIIILEDVYICISQRHDEEWCMDAVERREFASKKAQLAAAELAKLSRRVDILLGVKFSSLTIMRQTNAGSSVAKVRGGQVNKLIEVQSLELYCNTVENNDDSSIENAAGYKQLGRERIEDTKFSSMLAPLDVSVSLSVNRSGKLLNDAPQYCYQC